MAREKPATMRGFAFSPLISVAEVCHEGVVLPEVCEDPSPRLQGGPPPWQGLRDLQVEPAFQSAPALKQQACPRRASAETCASARRQQIHRKAAAMRLFCCLR